MSLTAGMWTGVSGLLSHGEKMNVIGNNIANVNTIGFKGQRMDFEDFVYQSTHSAQGMAQMGRGVTINAIMGDFNQGSFESTTNPTNLAIAGEGFFKVSPIGTDTDYFTRAGNFDFNSTGYLVDPHGYAVQGWKIDNTEAPQQATGSAPPTGTVSTVQGSGSPVDIRMDAWTVAPKQTTNISFKTNLAPDKSDDDSTYSNNSFGALFNKWDGTQPPVNANTPPIAQGDYAHQTTITVYDEGGGKHTLTVYFDEIGEDTIEGAGSGERMWEYIVTMNPADDQRKVAYESTAANGDDPSAGDYTPATYNIVDMSSTKNAGLLMSGTMTFNSGGQLTNQSAYSMMGNKSPLTLPLTTVRDENFTYDENDEAVPIVGEDTDRDATSHDWFPAAVSSSGFPMIVANFTGVPGAHTTGSGEQAEAHYVEIDFGLKAANLSAPWKNEDQSLGDLEVLGREMKELEGKTIDGEVPTVVNNPDGKPTFVYSNPAWNVTNAAPVLGRVDEANYNPLEAWTYLPDAKYLTVADGTTNAYPNGVGTFYPAGTLILNEKGIAQTEKLFGSAVAAVTGGTVVPAPSLIVRPPEDYMTILPNAAEVSNMSGDPIKLPNAFTSYDGANSNYGATQNGFGHGDLTNITVDREGVLSGNYSNGVTLPLYQVALYDFTAKQALHREGGNLFSQTLASGAPSSGPAGTSGLGSINSNNIEQSNVDLSREFVLMITTQRGFEANSKIITTTDAMLDTVVNMKR